MGLDEADRVLPQPMRAQHRLNLSPAKVRFGWKADARRITLHEGLDRRWQWPTSPKTRSNGKAGTGGKVIAARLGTGGKVTLAAKIADSRTADRAIGGLATNRLPRGRA